MYQRYEPTGFISPILLLLLVPVAITSKSEDTIFAPIPNAAVILPLYCGLLICCVVAYRLSPLHPLAKYPGPLRCKISKGWMAYIAARGDMHRYVNKLHKQYGDAVRTGKINLLCTDTTVQP